MIDKEKKRALQNAMATIKKKYGEDAFREPGEISNVEGLPTGSLLLDSEIGIGGLPRGRITEIYGGESCLDELSFLKYEVWSKDGANKINDKGGTIKRLYDRFHDINSLDVRQGLHLQNNDVKFYIKSVNDNNCIIRNEVIDVVKTGEKECFLITTEDGQSLCSTKEHKYLTSNGYLELSDLKIGDSIMIHNNTRYKTNYKNKSRSSVCVKYHPHFPIREVYDKKTNNTYLYYRGQKSRVFYEAYLNNLSYKEYVYILNNSNQDFIDGLNFLDPDIHIHHIDEDFNNNSIENLEPIDPSKHGKLHIKDRIKNLSFIAVSSKIINIEAAGVKETYDLKCTYPYNNYVANDIIVHNSGKTTLITTMCVQAQKLEPDAYVAVVDIEHAFDPIYAKKLGLDLENMIFTQPDSAEEALDTMLSLISSNACSVVVLDSVGGLQTKLQLEKGIGEATMAEVARVLSQTMPKIVKATKRTNTVTVFVNQIRDNIGVYKGGTTTMGGKALKFFSSLRIELKRREVLTEGDTPIGQVIRFKIAKNKVGSPFGVFDTNLFFGYGFDMKSEVVDLAIEKGIIKQGGAWFSFDENKFQGKVKVIEFLRTDDFEYEKIKDLVFNNINEELIYSDEDDAMVSIEEGVK